MKQWLWLVVDLSMYVWWVLLTSKVSGCSSSPLEQRAREGLFGMVSKDGGSKTEN